MPTILSRIFAAADSLAGRVAVILTLGTAAAAIIALLASEHSRIQELQHLRLNGVLTSAIDIANRLERDPVRTEQMLHDNRILGAREVSNGASRGVDNVALSEMLRERFGRESMALGMSMPRAACFSNIDLAIHALPDCWYVSFMDPRGIRRKFLLDTPSFNILPSPTLGPIYLSLIVGMSALLSVLVASLATAPLRRLTDAAQAFSVSVDPEPIPLHGPREVRVALSTFNLMQDRVREGFRERTQLLAGIAHDLQTPLTRLWLRLEEVENEGLKDRLVHDLAATNKLVREGLDLARSSETRENWSLVDLDSILSSIAEDSAEFGSDVRFIRGCGAQVRVKPDALARCINNVVENAVRYAGSAELSADLGADCITIRVRDFGPGIPEKMLLRAFEPFRRLDRSGAGSHSGTGLGLTVALAQARASGASLRLRNHEDGGLVAIVQIPLLRSEATKARRLR